MFVSGLLDVGWIQNLSKFEIETRFLNIKLHTSHHMGVDAEIQSNKRRWKSYAYLLKIKINIFHWMDNFLFSGVMISAIFAFLILWARTYHHATGVIWIGHWIILMLAAVYSYQQTRTKFYSIKHVLAMIDVRLKLNNQLSCANDGILSWPRFPQTLPSMFHVNYRDALLSSTALIILWATVMFIPVKIQTPNFAQPDQMSKDITLAAEWIHQIEKEALVEQETIEQLKEELKALQERPSEEWYNDATLESGAYFKNKIEAGLREMDRQTGQTLNNLELALISDSSTRASTDIEKQLEANFKDLNRCSIPLNSKILNDLSKLSDCQSKKLSESEMRKMKECLNKAQKACQECLGNKENPVMAISESGACRKPGRGGVDRGRQDAPMTFESEKSKGEPSQFVGFNQADLNRALPLETIEIKQKEHEKVAVEKIISGGSLSSDGGGGECVWRQNLDPDEEKLLKRYYR